VRCKWNCSHARQTSSDRRGEISIRRHSCLPNTSLANAPKRCQARRRGGLCTASCGRMLTEGMTGFQPGKPALLLAFPSFTTDDVSQNGTQSSRRPLRVANKDTTTDISIRMRVNLGHEFLIYQLSLHYKLDEFYYCLVFGKSIVIWTVSLISVRQYGHP
jgi:hypothetical protein